LSNFTQLIYSFSSPNSLDVLSKQQPSEYSELSECFGKLY